MLTFLTERVGGNNGGVMRAIYILANLLGGGGCFSCKVKLNCMRDI